VRSNAQPMTFTDDSPHCGAIDTRKAQPVKGLSG